MGDTMLSKIDLHDFFEINQGLYNDAASPAQVALLQALTQAMERATATSASMKGSEHEKTR